MIKGCLSINDYILKLRVLIDHLELEGSTIFRWLQVESVSTGNVAALLLWHKC